MSKYNIIQIGSFDVENYGDLLFPVVLEHELGKRLDLNDIYLFSPNGGKMPFFDRKVYSITELDSFCSTHKIDGIIIGGGDTIRLDKHVLSAYQESFFPSFSMWQYPIIIAQKYDIPIVFNCPGVPFDLTQYKEIINTTLKTCPYITVRDNKSKDNLCLDEPSRIKTIIDSVNIINDIYPKDSLNQIFKNIKKNHRLEDRFITIQINNTQIKNSGFKKDIIELIREINESYSMQVVLAPIGYVHSDQLALKKIYKSISSRNVIIEKKMDPKTMLALFSHSSGFIGASLHGIITSNVYHVPIMAINTNQYSKVRGYMELCDLENRLVEQSSNMTKVFKKEFFSNTNYAKLNKEKRKLSNHFDKISEIIAEKKTINNRQFFSSLLETFYESMQPNRQSLAILYDLDTNHVSEYFTPKNINHFTINNPYRARLLQIKFCNNPLLNIKRIQIFNHDNKKINYQISNNIQKSNYYLNPTISLETEGAKQIIVNIELDNIDPTEIINPITNYNSIIHSNFWRKTISLRKILSKFH